MPASRSARGIAMHVGASGLEDQIGFLRMGQQPVDTLMACLQTELARAARPSLFGSMPTIQRGSNTRLQELVQQVGADVARPTMATDALPGEAVDMFLIFSLLETQLDRASP